VYDVKSESQPDPIALLGIDYCLQIIETWFAEWFYASHTMGPAQILLKISARLAYRETYQMISLSTPLFSHWSIPLRCSNHILFPLFATSIVDTAENLPPVSTTLLVPVAKFAAGVIDTGGKFAADVVDIGRAP
jgi:hypothetical protein